MGARWRASGVVRVAGKTAAFCLTLTLAACGSTKRAPAGNVGDAGADSGGALSSSGASGSASTIGGASGMSNPTGGTPPMSDGGEPTIEGGAPGTMVGGASGTEECIAGAACTCGNLVGTLQCGSAGPDGASKCACPPAEACEAPRGNCFEPCGGDALGLWVLEKTCLPGVAISGCEGGVLDGTATTRDVRLEVLEDEPVRFRGNERLDLRAQVPLHCLGIESVNRCADADFYASPLFFGYSARSLTCEPSDCGFCECSGTVVGGSGNGAAWKPGASTLAIGSIEAPYCVEGDTMWVGGEIGGEPKVAYQLRRRSCLGKPLPCGERKTDECGTSGCYPGRCVPQASGGDAEACAEWPLEEYCDKEAGCTWDPEGCWGIAADTCDPDYCEDTPGCSWGEPTPRCGGERANCFQLPPSECQSPGCSMRTCDVPDGWGGIDAPPCSRLTASACAKAAGCTLSAGKCTGTTTCASQTDKAVCTMLECAHYAELTCSGFTTTPCAELSLEACGAQPGCRLEW